MIKDRGIILRKLPYSDSASIFNCFTLEHGQISLFTRKSKKSSQGHLQVGSFVSFSAKAKADSDLYTMIESQWDTNIPTEALPVKALGSWAFTVEILYKSVAPSFPIPHLLHLISSYYAHLCLGDIPNHALIPLSIVLHSTGFSDLSALNSVVEPDIRDALQTFGLLSNQEETEPSDLDTIFKRELLRFKQHFNIDQIDSLYLVE